MSKLYEKTFEWQTDQVAQDAPAAKENWLLHQAWRDVVFLHWIMPPELIEPFIPKHPKITLDLFEGNAWISLVAFNVYENCTRFAPRIPVLPAFTELNLRTYVTDG